LVTKPKQKSRSAKIAEHALPEERWRAIAQELRPLNRKVSSIAPNYHTAKLGEVASARIQIEFLRSVAVVNSTSDTTYTTQSKPKRARIGLALKHLTKARLALRPSTKSERHYIDSLKLLEADMSADATHRDPASRARDTLIADLILAWERWGGEIGASFQDHSGTGPLVRFLVASVGDIFTLTQNAARHRVQKFSKK
jgi:hypothetical protein